MPMPQPPQLEAARAQLEALLEQAEKRKVDLEKESWADIEKAVIKVLGGPFRPDRPEHLLVALGLASAFAERLADTGAFWFPTRDAMEGASLGFPEALVTLGPTGAVMDALTHAQLPKLEDTTKDIRTALAQVKFAPGAKPLRLTPEDYMRLFDPGFIQLSALDTAKSKEAFGSTPTKLTRDVRDAIGRSQRLPPEVKSQLEQQLVMALTRMAPDTPVIEQAKAGPRVVELMGLIFGTSAATGSAPEEFWSDVVFPLLFVGAPETFPKLDDEELAAAKQGIDPFFLFLDVVPYTHKAPEEQGLLGAFPAETLAPVDAGLAGLSSVRLVKVGTDAVKGPLAAFDENKTRDAIKRFGEQVKEQTGPVQAQGAQEAERMLEAALTLLADLKKVVEANGEVVVRRLTEAEAASEPALALVREALSAPRIILTS